MKDKVIGFVGIGMFALYAVRGLRRGGVQNEILLSPRGKDNAQALASECNCKVLESNQAVIDNSDIVIVSVRPEQFSELAEGLHIAQGKIIISAMAGLTVNTLKTSLQGSDAVYRTLPVCCSEAGAGLVPIYPAGNDSVKSVLSPLGSILELDKEEDFTGASIGACMNGALYGLYDVMVKWFEDKGFDRKIARAIVLENVEGTVAYAKMKEETELKDICASIATPGTYTLTGYEEMKLGGGLKGWEDCLNALDDKFKGNKND